MGLFGGVKDKLGFGNKAEWEEDEYGAPQDGYAEQYDDFGDAGASSDNVVAFDAYDPNKFENIRINSKKEPRVAGYDSLGSSAGDSRFDDYDMGGSGGFSGGAGGNGLGSGGSGSGGYSSRAGSRMSQEDASPSWGTPNDPSFIDHMGSSYNRKEVYEGLNSAASNSASAGGNFSSSGTSSGVAIGALGSNAGAGAVTDAGAGMTTGTGMGAGFSKSSDPYSQFDSDVKQIHRDPAAHLEIVRPSSYADVEKVANAAKAGKSVVLDLKNTKPDLAKRILDFSFGVASALNGTVDKVADRVFVFAKGNNKDLTKTEREYLFNQGVL